MDINLELVIWVEVDSTIKVLKSTFNLNFTCFPFLCKHEHSYIIEVKVVIKCQKQTQILDPNYMVTWAIYNIKQGRCSMMSLAYFIA